jgi:TolB-like protein/Tfp pilus assembly protein PilF
MQNLADFFSELKRRRVFRVAVVYAGIAFIIIQLADITFPALNLPEWTVTFVLVVLLIGFPITVGLAWAFDLTDKGVVKTPPKEEAAETKETHHFVNGNKALAMVAAVAIAVAAWSLLGRRGDPLAAFEHTVAVMPFENLTGDESMDIWERGLASLLITALSTSHEELYVLDDRTLFEIINAVEGVQKAQLIPSLAKEVAIRARVKNVILGDILKAGERLRLQARLLEVESGEVTFSHQVEGDTEDDLFAMAEALADRVKNYLEIKVLAQDEVHHLGGVLTTSAQAYRYFQLGMDSWYQSNASDPATIEHLTQSVKIDTNFTMAMAFLAYAHNQSAYYGNSAENIEVARKWARKAYARRNEMPYKYYLFLEAFWCEFKKTPRERIKWIEKALVLDPQSWELWFNLGWTYGRLEEYKQAIAPLKEAIDLRRRLGSGWDSDIWYLADSYHQLGDHARELKTYEQRNLPEDNLLTLAALASVYICNGDTARARTFQSRLRQMLVEEGRSEAEIKAYQGLVYCAMPLGAFLMSRANTASTFQLDQAEHHFRQAMALDSSAVISDWQLLNNYTVLLIESGRNIEEGMGFARRAVQLYPSSFSFAALGWGYFKQGKYAQTVEFLAKAEAQNPKWIWYIERRLETARKALAEESGQP